MAKNQAEIELGEDWEGAASTSQSGAGRSRKERGFISLNRSPLARKIITYNLLALVVLVAGVLYLNPFRDSLVLQRTRGLVIEARLIADVFEVHLVAQGLTGFGANDLDSINFVLDNLDIPVGSDVFVYDLSKSLLSTTLGRQRREQVAYVGPDRERPSTLIINLLNSVWEMASGIFAAEQPVQTDQQIKALASGSVAKAIGGETQIFTSLDSAGDTMFSVATPIYRAGVPTGAIVFTSVAGEIEFLVRSEREKILQMFVVALLVSVGLSLVLASTIANPLSDLAAAAEIGRSKDVRTRKPGRVHIPDLTARPDEIGRLSVALRGMVEALYDRNDANEQFAADVAHEIKNPLASLRSAVGTLRIAKEDDKREKLLDVVEHDVRRLDRLVSDISDASRLDSELVKEENEQFDLMPTLRNITQYLAEQAAEKGIEFMTDLPEDNVLVEGLEARLAQVFVNIITNAISFCEEGDAIRVWARRRENRVLVVIEDTGPGVPEQALEKVFNRFYSQRPEGQFGNNSGLGLAISKQIVEAHDGVIWAENIRPTDADVTSEPLGARFVVGLPLVG